MVLKTIEDNCKSQFDDDLVEDFNNFQTTSSMSSSTTISTEDFNTIEIESTFEICRSGSYTEEPILGENDEFLIDFEMERFLKFLKDKTKQVEKRKEPFSQKEIYAVFQRRIKSELCIETVKKKFQPLLPNAIQTCEFDEETMIRMIYGAGIRIDSVDFWNRFTSKATISLDCYSRLISYSSDSLTLSGTHRSGFTYHWISTPPVTYHRTENKDPNIQEPSPVEFLDVQSSLGSSMKPPILDKPTKLDDPAETRHDCSYSLEEYDSQSRMPRTDAKKSNHKHKYCYEMNSNPRGTVLILSNENFKNMERRVGTKQDEVNLTKLFQKLQYTVICKRNLEAESMLEAIKEFAEMAHTDSIILFLLSHGDGAGSVFGIDDMPVNVMEVSTYLAYHQNLLLKPKWVAVSACRGGLFFGFLFFE